MTMITTRMPPSRSARKTFVDGDLDEVGLAEDPPVDRHARRQLALQRVQLAIEPAGHFDRVGARLLLHADDDRRLAAPRALAALERRAFPHVRDVAHEHRRSPRSATTVSPISSGVRARPTASSTYS